LGFVAVVLNGNDGRPVGSRNNEGSLIVAPSKRIGNAVTIDRCLTRCHCWRLRGFDFKVGCRCAASGHLEPLRTIAPHLGQQRAGGRRRIGTAHRRADRHRMLADCCTGPVRINHSQCESPLAVGTPNRTGCSRLPGVSRDMWLERDDGAGQRLTIEQHAARDRRHVRPAAGDRQRREAARDDCARLRRDDKGTTEHERKIQAGLGGVQDRPVA
jgi:hypothetical protein